MCINNYLAKTSDRWTNCSKNNCMKLTKPSFDVNRHITIKVKSKILTEVHNLYHNHDIIFR